MIIIRAASEETGRKKELRRARNTLKKAVKKISGDANLEVSLLYVGEERIKELNSRFRKRDEVTDVLAFPMLEAEEIEDIESTTGGETQLLGDIVICIPYAEKQSGELGVSVDSELELLAVHGLLHLYGYDDSTEDGARKMAEKTSEILGRKV